MRTSESIKALAPDLAALQKAATNPKASAENPHFKSKFTPLNDLVDLARELAGAHKFALVQEASADNAHVSIVTRLIHTSGEWLEFDPLNLTPDKNTPQGVGSAITYGRRYTLGGLLGVATETDDDGNAAEPKPGKPESKADGPAPKTAGGATVRQRDYARNLFCDIGVCKHGKPKETEEARQARRDNNTLGIISWFEAHDITVRDEEAPLEMLTFEEMSALIEALLERKSELEAGEYPEGDVVV